MSRPLRLLIVLLVAAGAVGLAVVLIGADAAPPRQETATTASSAGPDFIGLVNEGLISLPRAEVERNLDLQSRLHVGLLRQTFNWAEIERSPGRYDFSRTDALIEATAARGLNVLPVLFGSPPFRSSRPPGGGRRATYPPRRFADMGAFAAAAVHRYGPDGTLWRKHPNLRKVPIRSWQVWNEPSLPAYWPAGPEPAEYARLLAVTSRAIRRVDPRATVVSAGIPQTRHGVPFERYANGLYKAGADTSFDVFAIHPYARDAAGVVAAVQQARRLMDRHGDHRPLWITEIGWASDGPPSDFTVGAQGQASRISATLTMLAERRRELRVRGVVYFNWKDARPYRGGSDFWGLHTGVLTIAGRPKPAFFAFESASHRVIDLLQMHDP